MFHSRAQNNMIALALRGFLGVDEYKQHVMDSEFGRVASPRR
jgi:hypothetical protein